MGYYTDYNLIVSNSSPEVEEKLLLWAKNKPEFYEDFKADEENAKRGIPFFKEDITLSDVICHRERKWYESRQDMVEASKLVPDNMLTLYGKGEDPEDLWVEYYLNGNICGGPAKIIYPEPDFEFEKEKRK